MLYQALIVMAYNVRLDTSKPFGRLQRTLRLLLTLQLICMRGKSRQEGCRMRDQPHTALCS